MSCQSCGKPIGEHDRVCRYCGALQSAQRPEQTPRVPGEVIAIALIALAVLCTLVVIAYVVVLGDLGNANLAPAPDAAVSDGTQQPGQEEPAEDEEEEPEEDEEEPAPVTTVTLTLSADALRLRPGAQVGLSVSVQAPVGEDVYVLWSSSDGTIATIDPTGMVTAVAEGECVLTASYGEVKAECVVVVSADAEDLTYDHLLPSDTRLLTTDDFAGMTQEEVMLARNEIFARHGRVFVTASIQAYFNTKAWYIPDESYDENEPGALSDLERQNLQIIINYEEAQGWR